MPQDMRTSPQGEEFLIRHEGEVLKAYRDPVGVWTIGIGLTSASGVIQVRPGMSITRDQSRALLRDALARTYEPRVAAAMPGAVQREFDAGVSFDFNTGAIDRASWVAAWVAEAWSEVEQRIKLWNKGGGRVLRGLVRRRQEEWDLLRYGRYAGPDELPASADPHAARIVLPLTLVEVEGARAALRDLGYAAGDDKGRIASEAVRQFQSDHDLTVDGILGAATLATLQRRVDLRDKAEDPAAVGAAGGAGAIGGQADVVSDAAIWLGCAGLAVAAIWGVVLLWRYRDWVAVKVQRRAPRLARWLRSI